MCHIAGSSISERVSRLLFADEQCLLSCGRTSGTVTLWDLRSGLVAFELSRGVPSVDSCKSNQSQVAWTCDWLARNAPMMTLLLLSSDGCVSVADVRNGRQNHELLSVNTGLTFSQTSHDHMTIRVSISCVRGFVVVIDIQSVAIISASAAII